MNLILHYAFFLQIYVIVYVFFAYAYFFTLTVSISFYCKPRTTIRVEYFYVKYVLFLFKVIMFIEYSALISQQERII